MTAIVRLIWIALVLLIVAGVALSMFVNWLRAALFGEIAHV